MSKKKFPIEFKFLFMNHWGHIHLLPCLDVCVTYSMPTIMLMWLVFRLDIEIYKHLPDWFMSTIWSWLNFDFIKRKEDEVEE